jgi:hypothetical protein
VTVTRISTAAATSTTPPDIANGDVGQSLKDIERNAGDARLTGRLRAHSLAFTVYRATEASHTTNVTTGNPLDAPYLPYHLVRGRLGWTGLQARDSWIVSKFNSLVVGLDTSGCRASAVVRPDR